MKPIVSVITATFNFAKYLPETIESVLQQTFQDWELIIVDDGSTDRTSEVVKTYLSDKRIRYIFQSNRGLSAARNVGLSISSGRYIQFLDADDLIHSKKLEMQSNYLESNIYVDVVFSDYYLFKDETKETLINPPIQKRNEDIKMKMLRGNFIVVNSPLSRKKSIDKVGGFDENLTSTEDWDLWLRMLLSGMVFEKIDEKLAFVRLHPRRMTQNKFNMYLGRYLVIKKNLKNVCKESMHWNAAKRCFVRSKFALMREYLFKRELYKIYRLIKEPPRIMSFLGILDFMLETLFSKNFF